MYPLSSSPPPPTNKLKRGQVVLDYDAETREELSLMAHEVLNVYELDPKDEDFLVGERENRTGKIPRAYIRIII